MKRFMLVYQAGIANVFQVKSFNLSDFGRNAKRIYQGDFRTAEAIGKGIQAAGGLLRIAGCNMAGDITKARWTEDLDSLPFSESFAYHNYSAEIGIE